MTHQVNDSASPIKDAEKLPPLKPQEQTRYVLMRWRSVGGEAAQWHFVANFSSTGGCQGHIEMNPGVYEIHRLKCGGEE